MKIKTLVLKLVLCFFLANVSFVMKNSGIKMYTGTFDFSIS